MLELSENYLDTLMEYASDIVIQLWPIWALFASIVVAFFIAKRIIELFKI